MSADDDPEKIADAQSLFQAAADAVADLGFSPNRFRRLLVDFALAWRPPSKAEE